MHSAKRSRGGLKYLKLHVLGVHSPFPGPDGASLGYLVEENGRGILLDCGTGIYARVAEKGWMGKLSAIILSHFHPDHSADIFPFSFAAFHAVRTGLRPGPLPLYIPPGERPTLESLIDGFGGLHVYFREGLEIREYAAGVPLLIGDLRIVPHPVSHTIPTYGFSLQGNGSGTLAYSGDSRDDPSLVKLAREADFFLCEAASTEPGTAGRYGHLTPSQAGRLAHEAACRTLMLTHFFPGIDRRAWIKEAAAAYPGPITAVEPGTTYEIRPPALPFPEVPFSTDPSSRG